MKTNKSLFPIILVVIISIPSFAYGYIAGKVVAVDAGGNISIEISKDKETIRIGDEVVVQEPAFGGMAAFRVGRWKTVEVMDRLVKAEVISLDSPNHYPRVNMTAFIYPSGENEADPEIETGFPVEKKEPLPVRRQKRCDKGDMKACTALAMMYKNGDRVPKDEGKAFNLMRKAAEAGYPEAGVQLSYFYRFGTGVKASRQEADKWLIKTAETGYVKAQGDLGYTYMIGKDYQNAAKWYRLAAEQGDRISQFKLGVLYGTDRYNDDGSLLTKADYQQAAFWYMKAAEKHLPEAQNALAELYAWGRGVPKDMNAAVKWYRRAAAQGYVTARYALERIGVPVKGPEQEKPLPRFVPPELAGVTVIDLTPALYRKHNINDSFKGVLVAAVDRGSAAEELLLPGDLIMRINDINIKHKDDYETFAGIHSLDEYDTLTASVLRAGYFVDVELSPAAKESADEIRTDHGIENPGTDNGIIPAQQDALDDGWEDL